MSTGEYRSLDAESDLPVSAAELAALAGQLFATGGRPGPDTPPQSAPVAPRGNVPDVTAATSAATGAVGAADPLTPPAQFVPTTDVAGLFAPAPSTPGSEAVPPQTVPVAPRGNAPDVTAGPAIGHSAAGVTDPYAAPGASDFSAFAVPRGIVPTIPGVLAGGVPTAGVAPRGSVPGWPASAPSVDLPWLTAPVDFQSHSVPGNEPDYYFLTGPVPRTPDDHEIFDVAALRADFPILRETVQRQAAGLVRQRGHHAEAASGDRPAEPLLRPRELQHPPGRPHAGGPGHRRLRSAREKVGVPRRARSEDIVFVRGTTEAINLVAQACGRRTSGTRRRDRHHPPRAPRQHRSLAADCAAEGAVLRVAPVNDRGQICCSTSSKTCSARARNWSPRRTSRTAWAPSRRRTRWSRWPSGTARGC